ncbi:hypothetical protein AHAS_Ahas13G0314800 [Arachis hypogaea]
MTDSSSSFSIKTQTVKIQATFETNYNSEETFQLLAKSRRNQEEKIQISIKNHQKEGRNIIQGTVLIMEFKKRKQIQEDSNSETESNDESEESSPIKKQKIKKKIQTTTKKTRSKKRKLIVEDSSPEQTQSYNGSEIGTKVLEELLRESKKKKNNEKATTQGKKGADLRSTEGHYDSSETKSPQIEKQCGKEIFEKFETPVKNNEISAEIKEKCYVWATHVKTYGDENTNEYDPVCTLKAQDRFILSKIHFASLKADTHIEAENMAIGNHPDSEFLQPKTKKPFRVEDYPMFIPFLDLKKLASHPYIFAPICYSEHWWLWVADVRKRKFYILDPYHKTCPSEARMKLNKFVRYIISRTRVYAGGTSQEKRIRKLNHHTLTSQAKKQGINLSL